MIDDVQLGVLMNIMGTFIMLLITVYHYVDAQ
eukprot:CAMPEP_0114607030 /NCGR_PEP_ID=MMETSP0168-20121206/1863_1 /TAXON_ID=95228 ORGANISM="Vannella sp., Strain DIVA3 517/6/12" /NCGR_SAMPLE_ID=MMETSP0168 /ASSEMBLY_ACC=CAM_ASM_000044 /LENGTH=31 /DNA_ID= /DNA_START= /DNA_END= /DNA_ORIENTATION=